MSEETHAPERIGTGHDPPTADGDGGEATSADGDHSRPAPGDTNRPERPQPLPVIGNLHQITRNPLGFFEAARGDDLMPYRVFTDQCYVVSNPEAVQTVLVDDDGAYRKGEMMRGQIGSLLGDGIFLAEGDDWQTQRATMQPAFYRDRVTGYADAMVDSSAELADSWEDGKVVDVATASSDLTISVLADTLLGIEPGSDREVVTRAAEAIAVRYDSRRVGAFLPEWIPSPTNRRYRRALEELRQTIDRIIRDRRRTLEDGGDPGADLLSILVTATADGKMDDETLRDNVVTFLFAGHETTALGLTYALYSLADEPAEQERLREEFEAFGDPVDRPNDAAARDALPATDRVVDETLRLYPPVQSFFREPARPVELLGTQVPAGTVLALSPWTCHRDPRWWDDPEEFRPERWSRDPTRRTGGASKSKSESARPEYAYFPFGGGPRHCIGMRFALLELRLSLATLLSRWRFEPVTETLSFAPSATLQPDGPVRLRVIRP
ncbi:cytochrome P450 [Halostagnicola sp. A-GB9-2]|uniref:cytochrome P450 n=1 Tax=Halostagnicola sp. A-GB9-2 TaxID=3048066 RepID=UPI0024C05145|nr:cytochrome P450 [Halostagnicola sp. A-GB9-2]MDJ1431343.1 cytochrome P450 [Halostagnicola sp. A-GB9-2]